MTSPERIGKTLVRIAFAAFIAAAFFCARPAVAQQPPVSPHGPVPQPTAATGTDSAVNAQHEGDATDTERVYVESADYMKYERATKITTLTGLVRLRIEESFLQADSVTMNENAKTLTATGRVVLEDGADSIVGTAIYYDYDKGYFEIANPEGSTTSDNVQGRIYYRGLRAWGTRKKIRIHKGSFTTCEPTCPNECHVTAKEIAIYPDIKIITRKARFFIGPRRVWYMPIHVITLKNRDQNLPEFGYSKEEGFFVKSKYPYLNRDTIAGVVLLDFFSKKGINYGAEHNYTSKKLGGKGYNKFKQINENDTGRVSSDIIQRQEFKFHKFIGRVNYNRISSYSMYSSTGRYNNQNVEFNIARDIKRETPGTGTTTGTVSQGATKRTESFNFVQRKQQSTYETYNNEMTLRQQYYLPADLNFLYDMRMTANKQGLTPEDREGTLNSSLSKRGKNYTLSARTTKSFDLDGDKYLLDNRNSVATVLPEVVFDLNSSYISKRLPFKNPAKAPNFTFRVTHGRYREGNRLSSTPLRRTLTDTSVTRTFRFSKNVTYTPRQSYSQYFYSTHDAKYVSLHNSSLNWKFDESSQLMFNYVRQQDAGGAPRNRDNGGENNALGGTYSINKARTNFTLSSGYNYEIKRYNPLNAGYTRGITRNSTFDVRLGFDLENDLWSPSVTTLKFSRKNMEMDLGGTWDTKDLELQNGQMTAQIRRNNGWRFDVRGVYERPNPYPFIREWRAIKTRCCSEVQFSYNAEREEYRLNFVILAMPNERIGFYSGREGFQIEESSLQNMQNNIGGGGIY